MAQIVDPSFDANGKNMLIEYLLNNLAFDRNLNEFHIYHIVKMLDGFYCTFIIWQDELLKIVAISLLRTRNSLLFSEHPHETRKNDIIKEIKELEGCKIRAIINNDYAAAGDYNDKMIGLTNELEQLNKGITINLIKVINVYVSYFIEMRSNALLALQEQGQGDDPAVVIKILMILNSMLNMLDNKKLTQQMEVMLDDVIIPQMYSNNIEVRL